MDFRWNDWNRTHIERHDVSTVDAEQVIEGTAQPFPLYRGDGKWLVWGRGEGGRLLQVVFIIDGDDAIFVIHARPLTYREKFRYRRMRKG